MNREFIKRNVVAGLPRAVSDDAIDAAIDEAVRVLGNLIHYTHGRSHFEEDVAYMTRVLLAKVTS